MAYKPTVWVDGETPVNAKNLNKLENGVAAAVASVNGISPDENGNVEIEAGGSGGAGADGFSPIASVTQTDSGAVITITDANGTTTATVTNGKDGADGVNGEKGDKGDPGEQGIQGIQGEKGEKGDTGPQGEKGEKGDTGSPGADGAKGDKGDTGAAGADGVSATHSWNGTVLTITSASGTSSANLKGEKGDKGDSIKGDKGDTGADGVSVSSVKQTTTSSADGGSNVVTVTLSNGTTSTFTVKNGSKGSTGATGATGATGPKPVKGTDYWTAADKESMIQDVISALGGSPIFGVVDANNNIVLSGNLPEGVYTLKYEDADGNVTEIGTLNHTNAPEVTYTNLFDPSTATINTRMSGTSSAPKAHDGYVMTASISIPATAITTTAGANTPYIVVPASMWSGSANVFFQSADASGYIDANITKGTVVGSWVKLPVVSQWTNTFTADRMVVSLYVKGSAISTADIQNIKIYFNECPE